MKVWPDKKVLLFGEEEFSENSFKEYDMIFMPSFMIDKLKSKTVDLFINKKFDDCLLGICHRLDESFTTAYDLNKIIPIARIECHYFVNKCFLPNNNYILDNIDKIKDIPLTILQGRFDIICPMISAYKVHKKLPKSILKVVNYGSHDSFEKPFINLKYKLKSKKLNK